MVKVLKQGISNSGVNHSNKITNKLLQGQLLKERIAFKSIYYLKLTMIVYM